MFMKINFVMELVAQRSVEGLSRWRGWRGVGYPSTREELTSEGVTSSEEGFLRKKEKKGMLKTWGGSLPEVKENKHSVKT